MSLRPCSNAARALVRSPSEAFAAPREVSAPLVDAYLARRALDYLFGFTLSGVLAASESRQRATSAGAL